MYIYMMMIATEEQRLDDGGSFGVRVVCVGREGGKKKEESIL